MGKETERKFLVRGDFMPHAASSSHIVQGYIARSESLTLRVRTRDERGYITIKGATDASGMTRAEWEYEIPVADARELLAYSRGVIDKVRYLVPVGRHMFEVDRLRAITKGSWWLRWSWPPPTRSSSVPTGWARRSRATDVIITRNC